MFGRVKSAESNGALALAFQEVDTEVLTERVASLERRVKSTELIALGLVAFVVYLVVTRKG